MTKAKKAAGKPLPFTVVVKSGSIDPDISYWHVTAQTPKEACVIATGMAEEAWDKAREQQQEQHDDEDDEAFDSPGFDAVLTFPGHLQDCFAPL